MKLNEYQELATKTAIYPRGGVKGLYYTALALGEVGEFQGKVSKIIRDDKGILTEKRRNELIEELGDIMWYVASCSRELNISLDEVCRRNINKVQDRQKRNVIKGDGDNR